METTKSNRIESHAKPRARGLMLISIALLAVGIWRIDGTLGALGVAGIVLLLFSRYLGAANLKKLGIRIEAPQRGIVGAPYPLRITLSNARKLLDANALTVQAVLPGGATMDFQSGWTAAGSAVDFDGHAIAQSRAVGRNIVCLIRSDFPLGLFRFHSEIEYPHEMLVFPRAIAPRDSPDGGVMLDASPHAGATFGSLSGDLRGLRTWRSGDSSRMIAWPASMRAFARGSAPVVRETDPPGFHPQRCLVMLHSFASGGELIRPERFERVLEIASGWIERLRALGIRTRVAADFDQWEPCPAGTQAEIIRLRERFARAMRRGSTEAHELQQALSRLVDEDEMVILLSDMPARSWQNHIPKRSLKPIIAKI